MTRFPASGRLSRSQLAVETLPGASVNQAPAGQLEARQGGERRAQPQALPKPEIRAGSLVRLASADKRFDGQVGRVVETNVKFAHTSEGLISVLLAPKGSAQGMWVAVPAESLTCV